MSGDHSIRKYDEELESMRSRVLQMGGLVESQVSTAMDAFETVPTSTWPSRPSMPTSGSMSWRSTSTRW